MARAGRSGVAYSLIAAEELPYLVDLHVFLGREIKVVPPDGQPDGMIRFLEFGLKRKCLWEFENRLPENPISLCPQYSSGPIRFVERNSLFY